MDRVFEPSMLLAIFGGGVIASALGFAVGLTYQPATAAKRAGEAWLVAMLGGFLAGAFVAILLDIGNESEGTGLLVGWMLGFPGLFDTVRDLFGADDPFFTTPENLLIWAAVVGTVAGGLHGANRIYKWDGWGIPQFVADVTWGLLGTTLGTLLNLLDSIVGKRVMPRTPDDKDGAEAGERQGVTIFTNGFATAAVLTQGSAVSKRAPEPVDAKVMEHEKTHVLQNRLFGPFFTLTYLAWMLLWLVPAWIADRVNKDADRLAREAAGLTDPQYDQNFSRVWGWSYHSNPWEVWGYHVEGEDRERYNRTSWPTLLAVIVAIPFYGLIAVFVAGVLGRTLLA
jgi:hypothetical protein